MLLSNGVPFDTDGIDQLYQVSIVSGSASIQMSIDDAPFEEIEGMNFSASANGVLVLSENCRIKAVTTGDAKVYIDRNQ